MKEEPLQERNAPIGIFDSGYGGLTVLKEIANLLPQYDYIYLGDNARTPYGPRSFQTVYHYTLQCVEWLFQQGCPLIIIACNTASAKALRSIQQNDLLRIAGPNKRVLGVIRPTAEVIGTYTRNKKVGILATAGTVRSNSYPLEIHKFFHDIQVVQQACPMWVPLVENEEHDSPGADYFIKKNIHELLEQDVEIDTVLLGCTHYPLMLKKIKEYMPADIQIIAQGNIVAKSLMDYLLRHSEIEHKLSLGNTLKLYTTDSGEDFSRKAAIFYGKELNAVQVEIE